MTVSIDPELRPFPDAVQREMVRRLIRHRLML